MRPLFKLSHGHLLRSSLGALGQILYSPGDHKWAPEQKYLPSNQDWNGLGRFHYSSWTRINAGGKCDLYLSYPKTIIEVRPGPLARCCTHQEPIGGTPEQKYLLSDQDWIGLGRGHYSSRTRINAWGRQKCGHSLSYPLDHY